MLRVLKVVSLNANDLSVVFDAENFPGKVGGNVSHLGIVDPV